MYTRLCVTVKDADIRESKSSLSYASVRYDVVGQPNFTPLFQSFSLRHEFGVDQLIDLATASGWTRELGGKISAEAVVRWLGVTGRAGKTKPIEVTLNEQEFRGMHRPEVRGPYTAVSG